MQRGSSAWLRHHVVRDKIWRIVDARGQVLGRLAVQIARVLQGKHKPIYMDNMDCGDPIVVINARSFALTGRKKWNKEYVHHTGYPGGLKRVPIGRLMETRPEDALRLAVKNMLPSNKLRDVWLSNLRIFLDEEHDHESQSPVPMPPAHAGEVLGTGGAPTHAELESWWLDHLSLVPDPILDEVIAEVRSEQAANHEHVGIAKVLDFDTGGDISVAEREASTAYVAAATAHAQENPVVLPPGFS